MECRTSSSSSSSYLNVGFMAFQNFQTDLQFDFDLKVLLLTTT